MMILLEVLIIILLTVIFYEDVRYREVNLFLFIVTFILFIAKSILCNAMGMQFILNYSFIGFLLLIIIFFTKIKTGSFQTFDKTFGKGDLFLWIILAMGFSFLNYLIFITASFIFSLLAHLFIKQENTSIPLAGFQALFYGIVSFFNIIVFRVDFYNTHLSIYFV